MAEKRPESPLPAGERRGAPRQAVAVPVIVSGTLAPGTRFDEKTTTMDVSARGARVHLHLRMRLEKGTEVKVENVTTGEQERFRVAYVNEQPRGGYEMGLEALEPSPSFWRPRGDAPAPA